MSDDDQGGVPEANVGITLPGNSNATYNIWLSPLFLIRAGRGSISANAEYAIMYHGANGNFWSSSSSADNRTHYMRLDYSGTVLPSIHTYRDRSYPLRCLVSTNNRLL